MKERVQKIIANSGYCSRRVAEEYIRKGKVRVNNKTIKLGDKADIDTDEILVNDFLIQKTRPIYIMLNKPRGYEVTCNPTIKKSVMNLIPIKERIFPIGRLDRDTTGLLLLTNDGTFANKLMHPRYEKEKTYIVKLDKYLEDSDIQKIENGVRLFDGKIKGKIKRRSKTEIELVIHEGRKWIIKRMFFKLGYYVKELSRIKIGNLKLDVKIGKWRFLTDKEVQELMK